jgi:hypothetical protein
MGAGNMGVPTAMGEIDTMAGRGNRRDRWTANDKRQCNDNCDRFHL